VPKVWDIGFGHVLTQADVGHPILGRFYDAARFIDLKAAPLTRDEGRALLAEDLEGYAEEVDAMSEPMVLSQNEFDALCSITYNCGAKAISSSTLMRRVREGNIFAAADEWPRWNRAGGRLVPGLIKRREAELRILLDAKYDALP
jgi:lysozyme